MDSWFSFTRETEAVFGLTEEQLEDEFFALTPQPGETSAAFVLRVELERKRLDINLGQTFHAFAKVLDDQMR